MKITLAYHFSFLILGPSSFRLFLPNLPFGVLGLTGTLPLWFGEVIFMTVGRMGVR